MVAEIPLQPETDNSHMQSRMGKKLASGNYLVPHRTNFVKECESERRRLRPTAARFSPQHPGAAVLGSLGISWDLLNPPESCGPLPPDDPAGTVVHTFRTDIPEMAETAGPDQQVKTTAFP